MPLTQALNPLSGVNVQAQVEAAIKKVVSEPREGEAGEAQRNVQRPVIPWPTTGTTPASVLSLIHI